MSPITHFLIGWTVANTAPGLNKRERAFVTLASVVPDLDGLGLLIDLTTRNTATPTNLWGDYHHTLAHNIGFALLVTALADIFAHKKLLTATLVCVSFHLHLLADLIGARGPDGHQWPIPYLNPFSAEPQLTWSGQWALNAWPNMLLTAALIALALHLART